MGMCVGRHVNKNRALEEPFSPVLRQDSEAGSVGTAEASKEAGKTVDTQAKAKDEDVPQAKAKCEGTPKARYIPPHAYDTPNVPKSEQLRQTGNEHYKSAFAEGLCASLKESRLEKALKCYNNAVQESANPDEMSSAAKNVGHAAWKLGLVQTEQNQPLKFIQISFHTSLINLAKAEESGKNKPVSWLEGVCQSHSQCLDSAIKCGVQMCKGRIRAAYIEPFLAVLKCNKKQAKCYIAIAQGLFFRSVTILQDDDFKSALSLLHDCHYPIEEASRLAKLDFELQSEVKCLREDVTMNMFVAESVQAIKTGDDVLETALEDEDLNMDMVWEAIDWYRKALMSTRERQVRLEAQAHSRIGKVYYQFLMMKERAKTHFRRCIQLSLTLYPCRPENEEWYKLAKNSLDKMQQEVQQQEDLAEQKSREVYIKQLESEIKELKAIENELKTKPEELLRKIYEKFPPSIKTNTLLYKDDKTWTKEMAKKAFQKAVLHYHPDKVDVDTAGKKLKVFHEEITKVLTKFYTESKESS